jgi:hypothetical protein
VLADRFSITNTYGRMIPLVIEHNPNPSARTWTFTDRSMRISCHRQNATETASISTQPGYGYIASRVHKQKENIYRENKTRICCETESPDLGKGIDEIKESISRLSIRKKPEIQSAGNTSLNENEDCPGVRGFHNKHR